MKMNHMKPLLKHCIAFCVALVASATLAWAYADCFFDGTKCPVSGGKCNCADGGKKCNCYQ
jgi:hypothetical protein